MGNKASERQHAAGRMAETLDDLVKEFSRQAEAIDLLRRAHACFPALMVCELLDRLGVFEARRSKGPENREPRSFGDHLGKVTSETAAVVPERPAAAVNVYSRSPAFRHRRPSFPGICSTDNDYG